MIPKPTEIERSPEDVIVPVPDTRLSPDSVPECDGGVGRGPYAEKKSEETVRERDEVGHRKTPDRR